MRERRGHALFFLTVLCARCAVAQTARRLHARAAPFRAIFSILKPFAGNVLAARSAHGRGADPSLATTRPLTPARLPRTARAPAVKRDMRYEWLCETMYMSLVLCALSCMTVTVIACAPGNETRP